ncbi:hypothetical protein [Ammoniphilus sp. CFH 90114]|uniref:hypothetical protein n=1 Tax=Ammoniphilus sp. CFH 90114 TaxID=2493665 RepID=UPI00100E9AF2|nr:hypothetical protein [Ammoniphilus sp. CFH 90114]RXT08070.1 hypothetical protein EIZ39_11715 [Ammoniphilus sp. CFH 90114]
MNVEKDQVEKELERLLTEGELPPQDKQKEAVKRLPPRWVAVSPSEFNQVEEETKILRKYVPKVDEEK